MKNIAVLFLTMGLFGNLFGQSEKKDSNSTDNQELRMEYNVMTNISLETLKKYKNEKRYKKIEEGIYMDLKDEDDAKYRMTISYELVANETNNQYPLEDILDKYLMYVSDFLASKNKANSNTFIFEFGGYLDEMIKAKEIIGKKVFNRDIKGEDGKIYTELIIE